MSRLHFAYICLYQVFEYHMEFLETFGCIWSSKEVIRVVFARALPGATSRSDGMRSLCTKSRSDSSRATAQSRSPTFQSDVLKSLPKLGATLPERQGEVARHFGSRKHEIALGATSRSDPARSLPKPRATCWSDLPRSLRVAYLLEFMFSQGPFCHFIMHFIIENSVFLSIFPVFLYMINLKSNMGLRGIMEIINEHSSRHRVCLGLCPSLSSKLDHPRSNPYAHEFSFPLVKK
ncbi:hypothetical protein IGI04_011849, partial [Brassica rapa subsp. trilocularis]